jgi:hypothetical protein
MHQLNNLINSDITSVSKMKRELKTISREILNSTKVQSSSTKLLDFYVNDMLSLA